MRKPTARQIESALSTLLWLYEITDDGGDRDEISHVRHLLHEVVDAHR